MHVNVAALPFTYGKLNGKAPIPLLGICYMGEYLAEIPPQSLPRWKWSMKNRIAATENARGENLDNGVKRVLLDLKLSLGKHEYAWLAAQNAVKEVIFKLLSPDLAEIAEIKPHDPFGASRLLWMLCSKFRRCFLGAGVFLRPKGAFWARAFSYANDVSNVQPRASMSMTPYEVIYDHKPNVTNFQPFGIECWVYVR